MSFTKGTLLDLFDNGSQIKRDRILLSLMVK